MNVSINIIVCRIARKPTRSFQFGRRFTCFGTGPYRSSWIFIQHYILKTFYLCYILIKYCRRAICCRYTNILLLLLEKNLVKVNLNLGKLKVRSKHLLLTPRLHLTRPPLKCSISHIGKLCLYKPAVYEICFNLRKINLTNIYVL